MLFVVAMLDLLKDVEEPKNWTCLLCQGKMLLYLGKCCYIWENVALLPKWKVFECAKVMGENNKWIYLDIFWEVSCLLIFEKKSKIFVDSKVAIGLATSKITSFAT